MRYKPRRAVGHDRDRRHRADRLDRRAAPAGQARGTLSVTVQVVAACGGTVGAGGQATVLRVAPPGSAPLAVLTESAPTPAPRMPSTPSSVAIEGTGELRYVTLIY